jgi:regulator of PEP synthase PpsR (kinase-PPPase family)
MGELIDWAQQVLGQEPLGIPGIYRQLHKDYFERVAAIEYSMAHDDGKHPEGWLQADILLAGVSRTGKTPLSLYLSVLGWKVANLPLVSGISTPRELSQLDRRKVIGLTIEPGQLLLHRQERQKTLGAPGSSQYVDPLKVYEEIREAEAVFRRSGFAVIDVTDKPIESNADEIIRLITRQKRSG